MKRGYLNPAANVSAAEGASYAAWGSSMLEGEIVARLQNFRGKDPFSPEYRTLQSSLERALGLLTQKVREGKIRLRGKRAQRDQLDWEQAPIPIDPVELPAYRCIAVDNKIIWDINTTMATWSHLPSRVSWFDLTLSRRDAICLARLFDFPETSSSDTLKPRASVSQQEVDAWVKARPIEKPWPPEAKHYFEAQEYFQPRHVGRTILRNARQFKPAHAPGRGRPRTATPNN